jgi:hypothetical protein
MRTYYELEKLGWDESEVMKALAIDAISDAVKSGQVEVLTSSHEKDYKDLHSRRAIEALKIAHEMRYGKSPMVAIQQNIEGGMAWKIVDEILTSRVEEKKEPENQVEQEKENKITEDEIKNYIS